MKPEHSLPYGVPGNRAIGAPSVVQDGQAVVEGLLVLIALTSLWVAAAWLGHLQDMALSAQHASRQAAFSLTRNPEEERVDRVRQQYFTGPAHQWSDRRGNPMLGASRDSVQLHVDRRSVLHQRAQPGGIDDSAGSLRRSWRIQDDGIVTAKVRVAPQSRDAQSADAYFASGLSGFNAYPVMHRHTAILVGAGHVGSDAQVQHVVAQSPLAWRDSASTSYALGKKIDAVMGLVDAPWHRERPVFDWLSPWAGDVPATRLATATQEGAK